MEVMTMEMAIMNSFEVEHLVVLSVSITLALIGVIKAKKEAIRLSEKADLIRFESYVEQLKSVGKTLYRVEIFIILIFVFNFDSIRNKGLESYFILPLIIALAGNVGANEMKIIFQNRIKELSMAKNDE